METRWDNTEFTEWLRAQLRRREWSEADLARRLRVPSGTVSRWMSGERRPSSKSCDLLADALGVEVDRVLTLAGHRPPDVKPPDDYEQIISLVRRIKLTPDRRGGLQSILEEWLKNDRTSCSASASL